MVAEEPPKDAPAAEEPVADAEMKEAKDEAKKEEEAKEEAKEDVKMEDVKVEVKEEPMEEATAPEEPKEPEKPKELEEDAPEDGRPKVDASAVTMSAVDTTLNVLQTCKGKLLMTLTEGGCQYLLASARATAGMKAGRYMFEIKIVETLTPVEGQPAARAGGRNLVRVGLSLANSPLLMPDGPSSVCFDNEGNFVFEKSRKKVAQKFARDQTVALLVNLDPASPNANTVSLFKDGARASEPQKLPEALIGKALFPTVVYKNSTLQVNFGPEPIAKLPFACRMLSTAAASDVEVVPASPAGPAEVLFPVGLPSQGFFDWVDAFLKDNPGYTELSDRKIVDWAQKSGLWRQKGVTGSNDKPAMHFNVQMMDDLSVRRVLMAIAPTQARNFIIPELRGNLMEKDRKQMLLKFGGPEYKRVATVIMGEPNAEFKEKVHAMMLADKQAEADKEKKRKAQEAERKRLLDEKKKKAEEARKAKLAAQKKKDGQADEEEKAEDPPAEDDAKEEDAKEEDADAPVELTEEEKKIWYRKTEAPDIGEKVLSKSYASFTLPSAEEGFDSISFAWQPEKACAEALKAWVFEKKMTQCVEDLQPGESFKEEQAKWQKSLSEWKKRQSEWKDPTKKKALIAKKKKEEEEKKKKEAEEKKEAGDEAPAEEAAKPMEINAEDLDVLAVEDIMDLGNCEPLFANFVYEDWTLLSLRYEIHLLLHSFKKDLNDADRPSFKEDHFAFYYQKYYKKVFNLKNYGVEKMADFVELIKENVAINETTGFFEPAMGLDTALDHFVKLTEDHRRERERRVDAGDETAKLKFSRPTPPAKPPGPPPQQRDNRGGYQAGDRGGYQGNDRRGGAGGGYDRSYGDRQGYGSKRPAPAPAPPQKQPRTGGYGGGGSYGGGQQYYRR